MDSVFHLRSFTLFTSDMSRFGLQDILCRDVRPSLRSQDIKPALGQICAAWSWAENRPHSGWNLTVCIMHIILLRGYCLISCKVSYSYSLSITSLVPLCRLNCWSACSWRYRENERDSVRFAPGWWTLAEAVVWFFEEKDSYSRTPAIG